MNGEELALKFQKLKLDLSIYQLKETFTQEAELFLHCLMLP